MANEDVRKLAETLGRSASSPGDVTYLRRGVISDVAAATNLYTVTIGGAPVPGVPAMRHVYARVGDSVDVLFDGPTPRIVGVVADNFASAVTLIAFARAAQSTGGVATGRYANGLGGGVVSQSIGTSQSGLNFGCVNVPVTPGHLLRVRFRFWAFGPFSSSSEWYFYNIIAENGGAYLNKGEMRNAPAGANAPGPFGEDLYVVPSGVTSISAAIDAKLSTGTGTLFRYNNADEIGHSIYTIEDLGTAA
jgi:hypothetical protein